MQLLTALLTSNLGLLVPILIPQVLLVRGFWFHHLLRS
jgi:hypothetical protein